MTKYALIPAVLVPVAVAAVVAAAPPVDPGHFERINMPAAPPEVLSRRVESARGVIAFGPYVSVQVNVNGSGNNIMGDAANEPSIVIDPTSPNLVAIAWRQFDTIASNFRQAGRAYSTDGGATWTFPGSLDPGQFRSDPVLGSDALGNFYFSSLSSVTTAEVFKSVDGGATWGAPVNAHGGDKQWIAVDDRPGSTGHIYQIWNTQFSCCGTADFTRSIDGGGSFQTPLDLPNPRMKWGTLDVGADGTLYLAGSTLDQSGHIFTKSADAQDPDFTPSFSPVASISLGGTTMSGGTPNPGGLLGQVWIAVHPTLPGHIYVLGSVNPPGADPLDVMFIRSTNDGASWSAPIRVNDDVSTSNFQWFGTMSVAPNGRIDVVWNDTRTTGIGTESAMFYSYSFDEGQTWSSNIQVSPEFDSTVGWPQQNKIGDYYHAISDDGGMKVAYSATFNGEQDVYFIRIARDCNNNSIDDDCDVACGAPAGPCDVPGCGLSTDCNENSVPDECEPADDCNNNTIPDICDIADNPSLDCNGNLLIDSCEDPNDCNNNTVPDVCDIFAGTSGDCNDNNVPDECDIAGPLSEDRDGDNVPDECEGACCNCIGCTTLPLAQCVSGGSVFSGLGTICGDAGACETAVAENDFCADAAVLPSVPSQSVPFNNSCATDDGPASVNCPASQPFGTDLWYQFTAPCTSSFEISTCEDGGFDMMLAVYGGTSGTCTCPGGATAPITCGDDTCGIGGGPAAVTVNMIEGRCYTIRLGGWNGSIGSGTMEVNALGVCELPPALEAEPGGVDKNRFISFLVNGDGTSSTALRVHLTSLHHPVPPPSGGPPPDFSAFEGDYRYVNLFRDGQNNPIFDCPDSVPHPAYKCARLGCTPEYRNWAAELGGAVLHVTGDAAAPSSSYGVALLPNSCAGTEETCGAASPTLSMGTARWGNLNNDTAVNAIDVAALVDKVAAKPGSLPEYRTLLEPQDPNPATKNAAATDIARIVDAVKGKPYPFSMTSCP